MTADPIAALRDYADDHKIVSLATVAPARVEWLWPGRIPLGKVTILDGDPGLGKSTILLDLAARGSVGGVTPSGEPLGVFDTLVVSGEDDAADTLRPRFDLAAGDPNRIHLLTALTLPDDAAALWRYIETLAPRLVYIDPIVAYLGEQVKTASDHAVRRALAPLVEIAKDLHCAIVAVRHLNKQPGGDAIYRGGGSIGFAGLARSVLAVGRDPDDPDRFVLASVKINVARRPPSLAYRLVAAGDYEPAQIAWEGESAQTAESLIGRERGATEEQSKLKQLSAFIRELVRGEGGTMLARDAYPAIENEFGDVSRSLIQRARDKAGVRSDKQAFRGGWLWELAEGA